MRILAFDSSLGGCSAALWRDDATEAVAAETLDAATGQAELLPPLVARVAAAGGGFGAIDRLAVTVGPGHFTGLRAGLAFARGLALATRLPLVGVTTLAAIAHAIAPAARSGCQVVVALDSKRAEAFFQAFTDELVPLEEPQAMTPAHYAAGRTAARPLLVAGSAAVVLGRELERRAIAWAAAPVPERPLAVVVARLAAMTDPAAAPAVPLYLHPPATTQAPRTTAAAATR